MLQIMRVVNFATIRMSVLDVAKSVQWYQDFFAAEPVEQSEKFASFKIAYDCAN